MIRRGSRQPERLLSKGTDLERRLLNARMNDGPPAYVRDRVARSLGVSVGAFNAPAAESAPRATSPATGAGVGGASSAVLPLVSIGVLGLVLGGTIVGARAWRASAARSPASIAPVASSTPTVQAPQRVELPGQEWPTAGVASSSPQSDRRGPRPSRRESAVGPDVKGQTALVDAARAAMASGAFEHALDRLHRYRERYPTGLFRPEVAALTIEALTKLGRMTEARALAEQFLAEQSGTPLADRVARLPGLLGP